MPQQRRKRLPPKNGDSAAFAAIIAASRAGLEKAAAELPQSKVAALANRVSLIALPFLPFPSPALAATPEPPPFPPYYFSDAPFREALASPEATRAEPLPQRVTGLTLPHHALALDLVAEGLALARGGDYERIVIVSPDHFRRARSPGATTTRDFRTVMGYVPTDREASGRLAAHPLVSVSSLASHEHGFRTILPLLAHDFPGVPVLTLAVGIRTSPDEWQALAEALAPLLTERTLLIQSTDFSHYLTADESAAKDAETLRLLAVGDPDLVTRLHQPDHIDSKAAQWIQMTLEARRGSRLAVVNQRNAAAYAAPGEPEPLETTSYITQVYSPDFVPAGALPGRAVFLGGDFHLGRGLAELARAPGALDFLERRLLEFTGGAPLVLNLEGALAVDPPPADELHPMQIVVEAAPALELMRRWRVAAAILANNHAHDLGDEGYAETKALLENAGILAVEDRGWIAFDDFDLYAATDLRNRPQPAHDLLRADDLLAPPPPPPPAFAGRPERLRLAFFHWGYEYRPGPNDRQRWLARSAAAAGFRIVAGCHSHHPSPGLQLAEESGSDTVVAWSLGNLLFDQPQPERGGQLLELRFFDQGTVAPRLVPVGNLYRELLAWSRAEGTTAP